MSIAMATCKLKIQDFFIDFLCVFLIKGIPINLLSEPRGYLSVVNDIIVIEHTVKHPAGHIHTVNQLIKALHSKYNVSYRMAVYNRWTGLVDWTTGLTDFHQKHTGRLPMAPGAVVMLRLKSKVPSNAR